MIENRKITYTKKMLGDALIKLLREKPLPRITVIELCDVAYINRTTFYRHYKDIVELFNDIVERFLEFIDGQLDNVEMDHPMPHTIPVIVKIFEYIKQNRNYIEVLMGENGSIDFQKKLIDLIYKKAGVNEITFMDSDDSKYVYIVHGSIALVRLWMQSDFQPSAEQMAKTMFGYALQVMK